VPRSLSKDSPAGQSLGESGGGPPPVEAQVSQFDEWRRLMVQNDVFSLGQKGALKIRRLIPGLLVRTVFCLTSEPTAWFLLRRLDLM
jgi:hypothetical protein